MSGAEITTGQVPRSSRAATAKEVAAVAASRRAAPNGLWGMVLLVCTEASLFGTLMGTYFYLRFLAKSWPPPGYPNPDVVVPLVLMGVLALTSGPMFLSSRAGQSGRTRAAVWWLLLATFVQCGYIAMQMHLFLADLDKFGVESAYGSIYYVLLGADHFHVYIGILLNFFLIFRLCWGLTNYRATGLRLAAIYWHFVNLLTIFVTITLLTPSL
jgi:heme/copper-type cytochrome/quinol oxidase subunit 3